MRKIIMAVLVISLSLHSHNANAVESQGITAYDVVVQAKEKLGLYLYTKNKKWNQELARSICALREVLGEKPSRSEPDEVELIELSNKLNLGVVQKREYHENGLNVSVQCQTAYLIQDNAVVKIIPVSTGKNSTKSDIGVYKIKYKVKGWQESSLYPGSLMYKPIWYNGNEGVHGMEKDSYVYPYPASHGCIRVKKKDIEFLTKSLKIGDTVKVYGKW